jgi:hypothetical protein
MVNKLLKTLIIMLLIIGLIIIAMSAVCIHASPLQTPRQATASNRVLALPVLKPVRLAIAPVNGLATIELGWLAMTDSIVAGYHIYCWPNIGGTNQFTVAGRTNASLTLTNVPTPGAFAFAATTYSAAGAESAQSDSVIQNYPTKHFTLAVPLNSLVQYSSNLITWISWPTNVGPLVVVSNSAPAMFSRAFTNA